MLRLFSCLPLPISSLPENRAIVTINCKLWAFLPRECCVVYYNLIYVNPHRVPVFVADKPV